MLERMSQLLVKSIRKFGGLLKDTDIFSVQPRDPAPISSATKAVFKEYRVHHEHVFLNAQYADYGFANKVMACDHYADTLTHNYLLFLDSDHLVLNDLKGLLPGSVDASMRVVNKKGVGTNGQDENTAYWKKLYETLGVGNLQFVETVIGGERIFSYYNAGLIFARRGSGIFQQWRANFEKVMKMGIMPLQGLFFVEQSVLSATIASMQLNVNELPGTYNYSPESHFYLSGKNSALGLDQINTFHYHRLFTPPAKINVKKDFASFTGPKLAWIKQELIACGINPHPFYEQWELDLQGQKGKIVQMMKRQMDS
ncbi:MAG: hypothetical protein Roseis2KO_07550 [Roseivirga sp.]